MKQKAKVNDILNILRSCQQENLQSMFLLMDHILDNKETAVFRKKAEKNYYLKCDYFDETGKQIGNFSELRITKPADNLCEIECFIYNRTTRMNIVEIYALSIYNDFNVEFKHIKNHKLLKNFNLSLKSGQSSKMLRRITTSDLEKKYSIQIEDKTKE